MSPPLELGSAALQKCFTKYTHTASVVLRLSCANIQHQVNVAYLVSSLRAWSAIRTILLQVIIGPPSVRTPPTFSYARRMSPRAHAFRGKINNKEEDVSQHGTRKRATTTGTGTRKPSTLQLANIQTWSPRHTTTSRPAANARTDGSGGRDWLQPGNRHPHYRSPVTLDARRRAERQDSL